MEEVPVEVRLMGGFDVCEDGHSIATGGPKQQLVMAVLALAAGTPVSTERLIDLVWDERPPRTARRTLQSYISSLKGAFVSHAPLSALSGGYVLDVPRAQVDLLAFEDDVAAALARSEGAPETTAAALETALAGWATPLALTAPTSAIAALLVPYGELQLQAIEALVAAQIDSGRAGDAVRRLEALVRENPTRENLWLQLARGLAAMGRRDAALQSVQRARERLREELGIEPSVALKEFEHALLTESHHPMSAATSAGNSAGNGTGSALPSGQVTFVFTDIEGSTKLLRSLGDRYPEVLDEHRRILRHAWNAHGGHEINVDGDAFFVAFAEATDAAAACIEAQQGLAAHAWPDGHSVRVRMGIHAGLAYPRDGDYAALAVHQAARIAQSAHGDQVVISSSAAETLQGGVADRLHPVGSYRVRDFDDPVRLYGVDTGTSDMHRHAPRLTPADGHNLTAPPGGFVDRSDEFAMLPELLRPGELVTITGPGGVGKTRLAIEVGLAVAAGFDSGIWMVALDSIDEPELVGAAVADAVGVPIRGRADPWDEIVDHLVDRQMLLIVDNCEHLLVECMHRIASLLQRCPSLTLLTTSRAPLGLLGERVVRLDPLSSKSDDEPSDAVRLFLDRAARVPEGGWAATMREVEQICADVDGLPLAIELVASRTDTMTPADIRRALAEHSPTLRMRDPRLPERHRTLGRLLDWNYRLLTDAEQLALRRLTVFASSFDRTTAHTAISGGATPEEDAELIWSLAEKSLVVTEPAAGSTRYRLLRTVRSYAAGHLTLGERIEASRRLAKHFASTIGPGLVVDRRWVGDVALELNNVRTLLVEPSIDQRVRQQLAWSIAHFHDLRDEFVIGIQEVERHLDVLDASTPERVALLTVLADLRLRIGDLDGAGRSIDAAATLRDDVGAATWDDAGVDRTRGDIAMRAGRHDDARRIIEEALAREPSARSRARLYDVLGLSYADTEEYEQSDAAFRRELELWSEVGDDTWAATTLGNLAELALRRGRLEEAARDQLACLEVARSLGQPLLVAFAMIVAAQISARRDEWRTALELQHAADAVLDEVGYVLFDADQRARAELVETARHRLGDGSAVVDVEVDLPLEVAVEMAASTLRTVATQEEPS